ncbi:putative ATPase [Rosellinia necatrix]|uniref:Putative ATPase n=1 Tax=Rosellinia necatrix TaxID=77044 RepID=A0A1S8A6A4_ROSNE|nr:putative ATPase [Rosellinia necatrix]
MTSGWRRVNQSSPRDEKTRYERWSVAKLPQPPFLPLTSSNMITESSVVEQNVEYSGAGFRAIGLLDEAGVYLRPQGDRDIKHSDLVSVLLRALNYCHSVLFLTTNRAFEMGRQHRLHLQKAHRGVVRMSCGLKKFR